MLTQNQLIIKLILEEHLNVEERKILDKNSLTLSFIAKAIEKPLTNVRFIPNAAKENGVLCPCFEGYCLEFVHKEYILPYVNFKFIREKYVLHSLGYHGEKRASTYKSLVLALKDYIRLSYGNCIDGLTISI